MRHVFVRLTLVVSTFAMASIVYAADLPTKAPAYAPPVAPPYNWTGSYVGGHLGYGWGGDPIDLAPFAPFGAGIVPGSIADNPHGVLGGIQYGTNWHLHLAGWMSGWLLFGRQRVDHEVWLGRGRRAGIWHRSLAAPG